MQSKGVAIIDGIRAFIRTNVRAMLLLSGTVAIAQVFIPWGQDDTLFFILYGSAMLGLGLPEKLWK